MNKNTHGLGWAGPAVDVLEWVGNLGTWDSETFLVILWDGNDMASRASWIRPELSTLCPSFLSLRGGAEGALSKMTGC